MHRSHIPHTLFTKYQKAIAKTAQTLGKVCLLCCLIVCGRRHNEECVALLKFCIVDKRVAV